jgi:hypothetical protein
MRESLAVVRGNIGLLAGVTAGVFLAATAINYTNTLVGKVPVVGKYAGLVSALGVAGVSFWAAGRFSKPELFVGFGSVAFALAVQQGVSLFTTKTAAAE